jgi:hypothetical protein
MTSQIRVDEITNRSGLGTVTIYDNGFEFTGVTTFTENVDIEGNLTIGGVLTYEDTTNIDSVGVITARSGIRVTGDSIHVESSEDRLLYLKSTDANAYLTFEDTDSSSAFANRVGTVSDGIYFSTGGGGERLRIDSSGRVLIGRTSPLASSAEKLTIDSGMAIFRRNSTNAAALYIRNEDTTADTRQPYLIFTDGGGNRGGFGVQYNESSLWISGQNGIAFRTSGSAPSQEERLRITSGGNVGIGTDNPGAKVDIRGQSNTNFEALRLRNTHSNGASQGQVDLNFDVVSTTGEIARSRIRGQESTSDAPYSELTFWTSDTTSTEPIKRVTINKTGNVGINEASNINGRLHVQHDALAENILYATRHNDQTNDKPIFAVTEATMSGMSSPGLVIGNHNRDIHIGPVFDNAAAVLTTLTGGIRITYDGNIGMGGITSPSFTTGSGLHLGDDFAIGFGNGGNSRPDFQIVSDGSSLDFRCGFGADTADISMTTGGNLVFASGGGIDFSATANSSGSMASELLDDYEEGTFTVTFTSGISPSATYLNTGGSYTKIGDLVTFNIRIAASGTNNGGAQVIVGNLPFTASSSKREGGAWFGYRHDLDTGGGPFMHISKSDTRIKWYGNGGSSWVGSDGSGLSGRTFHIQGFYYA